MAVLYTLDRSGGLSQGDKLTNLKNSIEEEPFKSFLDCLYPNGISRHGRQYIENSACLFEHKEGAIELYFEEVRRTCYSHLPSRFESMFCCDSLEDIRRLSALFGVNAPVYEIFPQDDCCRVNMSLLNNTGSILAVAQRAHTYWKGEEGITGQQPLWEIIAKLPVVVGPRVI